MTFHLDAAVVAFLVLACVGTGVLFGFAPALHVSKTPVGELLHEGGRTGGRTGAGGMPARRLAAAMVVVEVTLAVVAAGGGGTAGRPGGKT